MRSIVRAAGLPPQLASSCGLFPYGRHIWRPNQRVDAIHSCTGGMHAAPTTGRSEMPFNHRLEACATSRIEAVDGSTPHVYIPSEAECGTQLPRDPNLRLAVLPPDYKDYDRGYYEKGTRVYHANPAAGEPQGWVCIQSSDPLDPGDPGVWLPMTSL